MSNTERGICRDIPQKTARARIGVGYRVGRLTVEAPTEERKGSYTVWNCRSMFPEAGDCVLSLPARAETGQPAAEWRGVLARKYGGEQLE